MKIKILSVSLLMLLLVAFSGCGTGVTNTNVTKENYYKISNGMTTTQVIEILGEADTVSENEMGSFGKTEMWHYQLGLTAIDVIFSNGRVSSKLWTDI